MKKKVTKKVTRGFAPWPQFFWEKNQKVFSFSFNFIDMDGKLVASFEKRSSARKWGLPHYSGLRPLGIAFSRKSFAKSFLFRNNEGGDPPQPPLIWHNFWKKLYKRGSASPRGEYSCSLECSLRSHSRSLLLVLVHSYVRRGP